MAFRDGFETCPRCHVELVDARSARGCESCGGLWVEEPILNEMVLEMLPPGPFGRLHLAVMDRSEAPIACPSCHEQMHQTVIHNVKLDRCPKHGIWFDKDELATALLRLGDPSRKPPLVTSDHQVILPARHDHPALVFTIHHAGETVRQQQLRQEIIKIGRASHSHVLLDDPRVARLHAVIESSTSAVTLIDLGSADGTLVNGGRVTKQALHTGDTLTIGSATIDLQIIA
ncbi:MAG: FHA domain-containing protein [Kofleriaceae bacterium]